MKIIFGIYRVLLAAILMAGIIGVTAHATTPGFYLNSQQNVSIETGQYYTLTAQAGTSVISYTPFALPVIYGYQWYNTTGGQMRPIIGDNSRVISGIAGSPGLYTYMVIATSEQGDSISNSSTLNVTSVPSIGIYAPTSVTLDQGQNYEFKSAYEPGAENVTYYWDTGGLGVASHCTSTSQVCDISTVNMAAGLYPLTLQVRDGTEQRYVTAPVRAEVKVNAAPVVTATPTPNAIRDGNVTYSVTILNGTGPFNVSLYSSNGILVSSRSLQMPNETGLMVFFEPKANTTYYASAQDLGVASGPYTFNSAVNSTLVVPVSAPPGAAVNSFLLAIIVVLVIAIIVVLLINGTRGRGRDSGDGGSAESDNWDGTTYRGSQANETQSRLAPEDESPDDADVGRAVRPGTAAKRTYRPAKK